MKKQTKLIAGIVAVVVLIAAFIGIYAATRPETTQGAKTITVEVVHKDESSKTFTYHTDAEYLGEVLISEGLVVDNQGDYGLYILTVDGEDCIWEEDGTYWALWQNGEMAMQGADTTPVADGDEFALIATYG